MEKCDLGVGHRTRNQTLSTSNHDGLTTKNKSPTNKNDTSTARAFSHSGFNRICHGARENKNTWSATKTKRKPQTSENGMKNVSNSTKPAIDANPVNDTAENCFCLPFLGNKPLLIGRFQRWQSVCARLQRCGQSTDAVHYIYMYFLF